MFALYSKVCHILQWGVQEAIKYKPNQSNQIQIPFNIVTQQFDRPTSSVSLFRRDVNRAAFVICILFFLFGTPSSTKISFSQGEFQILITLLCLRTGFVFDWSVGEVWWWSKFWILFPYKAILVLLITNIRKKSTDTQLYWF